MKISKELTVENVMKIIEVLNTDAIVYLAGSIFEGFGNETSDVDVFVVGKKGDIQIKSAENSLDVEASHQSTSNFVIDGIRYDLEYVTLDFLNSVISKLETFKKFGDILYDALYSAKELDVIHRLKYAQPVYNDSKLNEILDRIDYNKFTELVSRIYMEKREARIEDAEGSFAEGDYGTLYYHLEYILTCAISAYIALFGETNTSAKWFFKKLSRHSEKKKNYDLLNLYKQHMKYPYDIDENSAELKEYVKKIIILSNDICKKVTLLMEAGNYENQ